MAKLLKMEKPTQLLLESLECVMNHRSWNYLSWRDLDERGSNVTAWSEITIRQNSEARQEDQQVDSKLVSDGFRGIKGC